MSSLSERAVEKLSVKEIWEHGLLGAPFPPDIYEQLCAKITLQNLYDEGLLTPEIDLELLSWGISNSVPNLMWPYINAKYKTDIFGEDNPFSAEGAEYIISELKLTNYEFQDLRKEALQHLAQDLTSLLQEEGLPFRRGSGIFVWSKVRENGCMLWKLLIIDLASKCWTIHRNPPTHVYILDNLDEFIEMYHGEMLTYTSGDFTARLISEEKEKLPGSLDNTYRRIFNGIKEDLDINTEKFWEELKTRGAILKGNFGLSLRELKKDTRVTVMGDYLYIVFIDRDGTDYIFVERKDGLLILTSFFLTGNEWEFKDVSRGLLEVLFV